MSLGITLSSVLHLPQQTGKPGRLQFIDALRGWAVLFMIETHVVNAMLRPELTDTILFKILNFFNGLVAPSFLFASGLAFAIASHRKIADYLAFRGPLFRHLGRIALLFIIAYGLHIPKFEYHHVRYDASEAAWRAFCQVDVLHCIAFTLLLLTVLLLILRSEKRLYTVTAVLLGVFVFATPLVWGIDFWRLLPVSAAEYLNGIHASLFPIFPWSSFVFAGALAGYYYLRIASDAGKEPVRRNLGMVRFAQWAAALVVVGLLVEPLGAAAYPVYDFWKTSPSFFMIRLGLVMLVCTILYFYEVRWTISPSSVIAVSGRESLLVYTVHLMILWGNFKGPHMVDQVNHTFDFAHALGLSALLIAGMIVLAYIWTTIKAGKLWIRRSIESVIVAGFTYVFFYGF